jgi:predicted CoA-binding protein
MITNESINNFLSGHRLAVVGASDQKSNFGGSIYRALRDHGYEPIAVNPSATSVAGDPCYPDLRSVPGVVDGVVVMVGRSAAVEVVRTAIDQGIERVWLFKGLGAPGSLSDEAVALCRHAGVDVVEGACPMMFLEPVGWFHRMHRSMRHANGSLEPA